MLFFLCVLQVNSCWKRLRLSSVKQKDTEQSLYPLYKKQPETEFREEKQAFWDDYFTAYCSLEIKFAESIEILKYWITWNVVLMCEHNKL